MVLAPLLKMWQLKDAHSGGFLRLTNGGARESTEETASKARREGRREFG